MFFSFLRFFTVYFLLISIDTANKVLYLSAELVFPPAILVRTQYNCAHRPYRRHLERAVVGSDLLGRLCDAGLAEISVSKIYLVLQSKIRAIFRRIGPGWAKISQAVARFYLFLFFYK